MSPSLSRCRRLPSTPGLLSFPVFSLLILPLWLCLDAVAAPVPPNMLPIAVSGWNKDVVVEATASGPPFTNVATEMNAGEGTGFYQTGLPGYQWGLPPSGQFVSLLDSTTIFQIPPYTGNNALVLSPDTGLTSGTLTLATPATYASIAVLAHSGNGTNYTGSLTFNFTDGTSFVTNYYAPDWFNIPGTGTRNETNVAWFGTGRINLTSGSDSGWTGPQFYQTTINLAAVLGATNKPLASITFGKAQAKSTAIYAVSGQLASSATPLSLTGWNQDLVVENTASGPPYTAYAAEFNPGEGLAYYQNGLAGTANGLPRSGAFSSALDGTLFQLQPYTANNALVMSSATGTSQGTLSLSTPTLYNSLAIVANSAAGGGTANLTLHFADGTSFTTNYSAPDWFTDSSYALGGLERINLATAALSGAPGFPRLYQTTLDLVAIFGATNRPLASLSFSRVPSAGATAVYAVSGVKGGQTGGAVTVATVTNTPAAAVQTRSAILGGRVVASGGDTPEVLLYYGPSDGGTNGAAWAQRVFLGAQTTSFAQTVSGLAPGATYYCTVAAVNAAGTAWATPSQSFTTVSAGLATVTNLPAANLTTNSALLSGQVLATGGDAPTVTLYYGPSNGGNNPGAWAHSLGLGTQVGRFAQLATGLTPNTTFYYTAQAVNGAGQAWASPVGTFTTPASNGPASTLVPVLTYRYANDRAGVNTNEAQLTLSNVNSNTFGKLVSYALDGYMPAQPLVLTNVAIPGKGVHNVVYAATEHNSVYAFDADGQAGTSPLWQASFINSTAGVYCVSATTDLPSAAAGFDGPELGINGTPVIDPASGTLYVVAETKEVVNGVTNFFNKLHALDVATGAEKFGGPVVVGGAVPGVGDGHDQNGNVPFEQLKHHNREGLLLVNGTLVVTFTGHYDYSPYHGWVFTFNPYTLAQTGIWNVSPNGAGGGFWQAACGPAADAAGNVYLESGNGTWDATNNNFGDSVIKLAITNGITVADWFTPYNQLDLFIRDIDVGSAGQILLPDTVGSAAHPHLMVAGSKTGTFYLLDRDNMGHFNAAGDTQIVQEISGAVRGMWCTPAFFNGVLYYLGAGDYLKAFAVSNATVNTTPLAQSLSTHSGPGASPVITANGTNNAIAWVLETGNSPAVLHAYNATNVAQELYNSSQNLARDNPGPRVKWVVPPVANGKVYVASQNALTVYGNSLFMPAPVISPSGGLFTNFVTVTLSSSVNGASIYYTLDGTTPTTNSTLYTGPFQLTQSAGVQAIATLPGSANNPVALATFISADTVGRGTGLLGQYYSNSFPANPFVGSPLVQTDAVVNFNWNSGPPAPGFGTVNYTVRWTGMVQPDFSEDYTFYTTTDDGVRLWVNGQLLVDRWQGQSPTTWKGTLHLQAHQLYLIEMDYFQAGGGAVAQLAWSSPSTAQTIIPQSQLYPLTTLPPVMLTSAGLLTNQAFQLQASGMAGEWYILQGTTDLVNWVSLGTNIAPTNLFFLVDPAATNFPRRFYRAIGQP